MICAQWCKYRPVNHNKIYIGIMYINWHSKSTYKGNELLKMMRGYLTILKNNTKFISHKIDKSTWSVVRQCTL